MQNLQNYCAVFTSDLFFLCRWVTPQLVVGFMLYVLSWTQLPSPVLQFPRPSLQQTCLPTCRRRGKRRWLRERVFDAGSSLSLAGSPTAPVIGELWLHCVTFVQEVQLKRPGTSWLQQTTHVRLLSPNLILPCCSLHPWNSLLLHAWLFINILTFFSQNEIPMWNPG